MHLTATDLKADGELISLQFRKPLVPGTSIVTFTCGTLVPEDGGVESSLLKDFREWRRARLTGRLHAIFFGLCVLFAAVGSAWAACNAMQAVAAHIGYAMPTWVLLLGAVVTGHLGASLVVFALVRPLK